MLMYSQADGQRVTVWNHDPTLYQDAIVMLSHGQEDYKAVGYIWNAYLTTGTDTMYRGQPGTIKYKGRIYNTYLMSTNGTIGAMYLLVR